MARSRRWSLVRDVSIATGVLGAVYVLGARYQFDPVVVPYYFLVVGFDMLEVAFGPVAEYRSVLVGAYLLFLGTLAASALHLARSETERGDGGVDESGAAAGQSRRSGVRLGIAAPLLALALLALPYAAVVGSTTGQREPAAIAGLVGVASLALAAVVSGVAQRALRSGGTAPVHRR